MHAVLQKMIMFLKAENKIINDGVLLMSELFNYSTSCAAGAGGGAVYGVPHHRGEDPGQ